jgi:hypothetical protein
MLERDEKVVASNCNKSLKMSSQTSIILYKLFFLSVVLTHDYEAKYHVVFNREFRSTHCHIYRLPHSLFRGIHLLTFNLNHAIDY